MCSCAATAEQKKRMKEEKKTNKKKERNKNKKRNKKRRGRDEPSLLRRHFGFPSGSKASFGRLLVYPQCQQKEDKRGRESEDEYDLLVIRLTYFFPSFHLITTAKKGIHLHSSSSLRKTQPLFHLVILPL